MTRACLAVCHRQVGAIRRINRARAQSAARNRTGGYFENSFSTVFKQMQYKTVEGVKQNINK